MRSQITYRQDTFEHALQTGGWTCEAQGAMWRRRTKIGSARLRFVGGRGRWRHFELSASALPTVRKRKILSANGELAGPLKYVLTDTTTVACRVDVPDSADWVSQGEFRYEETAASDPPFTAFVRAIGAVVDGVDGAGGAGGADTHTHTDPAAEQTVTLLRDAGYSVSVDGQRVQIHINYGGVYRQMRLEPDGVSAEIANLAGYSAESCRSALWLVQQANQRLPLVRFAVPNHAPETVVAEVRWATATNSAAWLLVSIACVDAAIALTARELEAVRDPQLGEVVAALSGA